MALVQFQRVSSNPDMIYVNPSHVVAVTRNSKGSSIHTSVSKGDTVLVFVVSDSPDQVFAKLQQGDFVD